MSIKEKYKSNIISVAALAALALVMALLMNVPMITANPSGGNFLGQDNRSKRSSGSQRGANSSQRSKNGQAQRGQTPGSNSSATADSSSGDGKTNTKQAQRTAPKPTGANLSDKQKKNVQELITDLQSIAAGSTVTQDQITALGQSLMTLAQGTTKPSQASVDQLAADLADVLSDGGLSKNDIKLLAEDISAVMNSANIPQSEVDAVIASVQTVFQASGVDQGDLQEIRYDLEKIAAEIRKNVGSAKEKAAGAKSGMRRKP